MTERLWQTAAALSDSLRETPKVKSFLRAFDRDAGDLAVRVNELTAVYSSLRISPLLLGVRLNHMAATAQLLRDDDDEAWLADAVEVGTAFQVVVEFVRSRLPGYPMLRVPHRRTGAGYLIEIDEHFFHHFPWDSELSRLGLQLAGAPDMTKLGGADDCAELLVELAGELANRHTWRRFAETQRALSESDRTTLSELGARFSAAVTEDAVVQHAGSRLMAQYEYRMAVLHEQVASSSERVLRYLRAFEAVDELITVVAAFMQTLIVSEQLVSVHPERIDLGQGDDVAPVSLLLRPGHPLLNPGEVISVQGPPPPDGIVYPKALKHSWGKLDDPGSSTTRIDGRFLFL